MNTAILSEPRQKRSRITRDRICEATLELLSEKHFNAISVDEIVVRAECSTSSFYARFSSKIVVLYYLQGCAYAEAEELMDPLDDVNAKEFATPVLLSTAILSRYMDWRRKHSALLRTLRSLETEYPKIRTRREDIDRRAFAAIKRALLRVLGRKPGGAVDATLERSMWVFAAASRAVLDDPRHDRTADPRQACNEAVELLVRTGIPAVLHDDLNDD